MTAVKKNEFPENTVIVCDDPQYCADCDQLLSPLGIADGPDEEILECVCPQCGKTCRCSALSG